MPFEKVELGSLSNAGGLSKLQDRAQRTTHLHLK